MNNKLYLSVVIPACNEADNLPAVLIDIDKHLRPVEFSYEILVIDNASSDNTADVAHKFLPIVKGLRLIANDRHYGGGEIMRQGETESVGQFVLFMEADNAVSINYFFQMIAFLENKEGKKNDIILGSRYMDGSIIMPRLSLPYRIYQVLNNMMIRALLLPEIRDPQSHFRCFTKEAAKCIFSVIETNHFATDIEALVIGNRMGYNIKEIPVTWANNFSKSIKLSSYFYILRDILKIRARIWTNHYKLSR